MTSESFQSFCLRYAQETYNSLVCKGCGERAGFAFYIERQFEGSCIVKMECRYCDKRLVAVVSRPTRAVIG